MSVESLHDTLENEVADIPQNREDGSYNNVIITENMDQDIRKEENDIYISGNALKETGERDELKVGFTVYALTDGRPMFEYDGEDGSMETAETDWLGIAEYISE